MKKNSKIGKIPGTPSHLRKMLRDDAFAIAQGNCLLEKMFRTAVGASDDALENGLIDKANYGEVEEVLDKMRELVDKVKEKKNEWRVKLKELEDGTRVAGFDRFIHMASSTDLTEEIKGEFEAAALQLQLDLDNLYLIIDAAVLKSGE